jgi:hypothetical protein
VRLSSSDHGRGSTVFAVDVNGKTRKRLDFFLILQEHESCDKESPKALGVVKAVGDSLVKLAVSRQNSTSVLR